MEDHLMEIIRSRRSTRTFGDAKPGRDTIVKIVESSIYAPYGGATGIPLEELRKIYVFERGTASMDLFKTLLIGQIKRNSRKLDLAIKFVPPLRKKVGAFAARLRKFSGNGIPALDQAAYIIVIAEKKGFPPVEKKSLAHAMQNMWLTSTDLKLGFQLISAIGTLNGNREFMKLLNLDPGKFVLDGCAIGVTTKQPTPRNIKNTERYVCWI